MEDDLPPRESSASPPRRTARIRALRTAAVLLVVYFVAAYLLLPVYWEHYTHRHPAIDDIPTIVYTATGIPGDPLNVAFIGAEVELKKIVLAAKWFPADPLTLRSCLEIAEATVLKRPYDDAPVSSLYFEKRKEDLAFEQPVGPDPRERHHVRFWRTKKVDADGRPVWVGSATFDRRVGLSETTGEITHHIAADVDAERDHLFKDLNATGDLSETYVVAGFHKIREGRNGGGDPWHTDGDLDVGVIKPAVSNANP